jgi:hypothetical protein
MPVLAKVLIQSKFAEGAQTTQYTSVAARTIIDKFTATNTSGSNVSLSVNMVPSGNAPGASNLVVDARVLAPDETYTCPELVGHILDPGNFISTLASAASAVVLRASGREVT